MSSLAKGNLAVYQELGMEIETEVGRRRRIEWRVVLIPGKK